MADSPGLGSLASAALTAGSTLLVASFAAIVGVLIAREFGRTDETDGFFAAYGVSSSSCSPPRPSGSRSRLRPRAAAKAPPPGGRRLRDWAIAIVAVLLLLLAARRGPLASLLTGGESDVAQEAGRRSSLDGPAAVAHLFAGLAASGLAALDDYATAAFGYAAGSARGLRWMLARVDLGRDRRRGWGMMLNGAIALLVPVAGLAWRARATRMPRGAVRPTGKPLASRLGVFATAASLPIALQRFSMSSASCSPAGSARGR